MNDELRFGPDGYVDMDAFTADDPDDALSPELADRLHEVLHAAPEPTLDTETWATLVDRVVYDPPEYDTEWLLADALDDDLDLTTAFEIEDDTGVDDAATSGEFETLVEYESDVFEEYDPGATDHSGDDFDPFDGYDEP